MAPPSGQCLETLQGHRAKRKTDLRLKSSHDLRYRQRVVAIKSSDQRVRPYGVAFPPSQISQMEQSEIIAEDYGRVRFVRMARQNGSRQLERWGTQPVSEFVPRPRRSCHIESSRVIRRSVTFRGTRRSGHPLPGPPSRMAGRLQELITSFRVTASSFLLHCRCVDGGELLRALFVAGV